MFQSDRNMIPKLTPKQQICYGVRRRHICNLEVPMLFAAEQIASVTAVTSTEKVLQIVIYSGYIDRNRQWGKRERIPNRRERETLIQLIRGWLSRVMTPTPGSVILQVAQGKANECLVQCRNKEMLGETQLGIFLSQKVIWICFHDSIGWYKFAVNFLILSYF